MLLTTVEPLVVVKPAQFGLGVFAAQEIAKGSFLCEYVGENITNEELVRRYPSMEPEYVFRVGENYIDACDSDHWSKRMNHDAINPTVTFEVEDKVLFYANTDIAVDEELCFDYGVEFWDGRSGDKPSNDDRIYSEPVPDCESIELGVPLSLPAVTDVLRDRDAPRQNKKAAIMRALDYFGIDKANIRIPPRKIFFWRRDKDPTYLSYEQASLSQLARALRAKLREADDDFDDLI